MKNGFRNAKVGDRVWDIMHGWGKIIKKYKDPEVPYPIVVSDFENMGVYTEAYNWDGKAFRNHINPILFWDEVQIEPPPKPEVQPEWGSSSKRPPCCTKYS